MVAFVTPTALQHTAFQILGATLPNPSPRGDRVRHRGVIDRGDADHSRRGCGGFQPRADAVTRAPSPIGTRTKSGSAPAAIISWAIVAGAGGDLAVGAVLDEQGSVPPGCSLSRRVGFIPAAFDCPHHRSEPAHSLQFHRVGALGCEYRCGDSAPPRRPRDPLTEIAARCRDHGHVPRSERGELDL
jgi:hypothetical protein